MFANVLTGMPQTRTYCTDDGICNNRLAPTLVLPAQYVFMCEIVSLGQPAIISHINDVMQCVITQVRDKPKFLHT